MSKWVEFYKDRMNEVYYEHVCLKYKNFIDIIYDNIDEDSIIVELGCGMGNITRVLIERNKFSNNSYKVLDIDKGMLHLCMQNFKKLNNIVKIHNMDIRKSYLTGDIAHSHGVLEHFSDSNIKCIIENQLLNYKKIFHYVPSAKYEAPSFGDERLLTKKEWQNICNPDEIVEFNEGFDLVLIWK